MKLQCKINYNDDQTVEEKHLAQEESVEKGEKENLLANAFAKLQNGEENVPGKKIVAMNWKTMWKLSLEAKGRL